MTQPELERRQTASGDGTPLCYYVGGAVGAPTLVLAASIAPGAAWRPLLGYLGHRLRLVTWDARGLFGSGTPSAPSGGFAITRQLADLHAVLAAERVERLALLGFSFGVQLALEAYRELGDRIGCLVLVSGAAGRPLDALGRGAGVFLRRALDHLHGDNGRPLPRALTKRMLAPLFGPTLPPELREELYDAFATVAASSLLGTINSYAHHDASGSLDDIEAPTLIVAGGRDRLAPAEVMQQVARHIRRSEVLLVPAGHHLVFAEYPDLVNLRLERFFEDVGWC